MKTKILFAGILLASALLSPAATNDLNALLQQGLLDEEASHDLHAAIADYQSLAAQFDKDRQVAATAIYRLGECYRKLGQTNEAAAQYERVVREFADQKTLATLSQQDLTGMGISAPSAASPLANLARQRQQELLEDEIKVVEQQLEIEQMKSKNGLETQDAVFATQQKLLELKRQSAALEGGQAGSPLAAAPTDKEDEEIRDLQTMLQNSPDIFKNNGELERAANLGQLRVAAFLLDHGVDVDADVSGDTPLYDAAQNGQKTMVELLLSRGADVNARDASGETALLTATERGLQSVVEVLLAHRADVNLAFTKMNGEQTPLHVAAQRGYANLVNLLLAAGANPNVKDSQGLTPLDYAVEKGSPEIVKSLLAAKADPNARDDSDRTPLDFAKITRDDHPELAASLAAITDLLHQHGALDNPPNWDCITVSRPSANFSAPIFRKGTNDWNHFTLLELIAVQCQFLAASPEDEEMGQFQVSQVFFANNQTLPFADLAHLRIHRPSRNSTNWSEQTVDLESALNSGDCPNDLFVEWGDVVEIPEVDHPLNERWHGFSALQLTNLQKCLTRHVEVIVKGHTNTLPVGPRIKSTPVGGGLEIETRIPCWLSPTLLGFNLVLSSSDLSRVKVTRLDPITGQKLERVFNCTEPQSPSDWLRGRAGFVVGGGTGGGGGRRAPFVTDAKPVSDLWLRDGDVIEVPEKP
ncbi:MAG: ankyrin repeat domain-containing protein [Verrucomicrobiota bacterium]|jgi:ankyrin repeat protein